MQHETECLFMKSIRKIIHIDEGKCNGRRHFLLKKCILTDQAAGRIITTWQKEDTQ